MWQTQYTYTLTLSTCSQTHTHTLANITGITPFVMRSHPQPSSIHLSHQFYYHHSHTHTTTQLQPSPLLWSSPFYLWHRVNSLTVFPLSSVLLNLPFSFFLNFSILILSLSIILSPFFFFFHQCPSFSFAFVFFLLALRLSLSRPRTSTWRWNGSLPAGVSPVFHSFHSGPSQSELILLSPPSGDEEAHFFLFFWTLMFTHFLPGTMYFCAFNVKHANIFCMSSFSRCVTDSVDFVHNSTNVCCP